MIYEWTKKLHMWSGLLTFTAFVVWGLVFEHRPPVVFVVGIGADAARTESSGVDRIADIAVGVCPVGRCD